MKIWEAIIYGIIGGLTEVLPVSFAGHAALLRGAFNLSSLNEGSGLYVRAAICLGVALAVLLAFINEVIDTIRLEPLKDRLHYLVEKRFRGELNKCEGCKLCH